MVVETSGLAETHLMLILFFAAAAADSTTAPSPATTANGPGIVVIAPKEKKVCTMEAGTGTRAGLRKICRTVSEEREARAQNQETFREAQAEQRVLQSTACDPRAPVC